MKIVTKKISDLKTDLNTVKEHPAEQIKRLKSSITEFGFNKPLVVGSDDQVLAGAGVLKALTELGMSEAECVDVSALSKDQQMAFVLADNKLSEYSAWNMASVSDVLSSLKFSHYDLELTAFNSDDLQAFNDRDLGWMGEDEGEEILNKEKGPSKTDEGFVSIEFVVPIQEKSRLMEKIREVKLVLDLEQDGEALVAIIESYGG
tara:strand:- start:2847 stop:3458 length:612 start_codon:yes stop_codon:yes gene_type:complete